MAPNRNSRGGEDSHNFDFNPNSYNAQFATIIEKLKAQDGFMALFKEETQKTLLAIKEETQKTNGRVTALEKKNTRNTGWLAGAGFVLIAIWEAIKFFFGK